MIAVNTDGSTAAHSLPSGPVSGPAATATAGVAAASPTPAPARPAPDAAAPSRGRAVLRIAGGGRRGRSLGRIAFQVAAGRLRTAPARVRLARGRYTVRLCTTAGGTRCARRSVVVRRRSAARLPSLSIRVPSGSTGRVSYTLRARGGAFRARTAERVSAGLLLGP